MKRSKENIFANDVGKTRQPQIKIKIRIKPHILHKSQLKWTEDIKIRPEFIKYIKETLAELSRKIEHREIFNEMTAVARKT